MISDIKQGQNKTIEGIEKLLLNNKEKNAEDDKNQRDLIGLKEKLMSDTNNEICCLSGHKLYYEYFIEKISSCAICKNICEVGHNCSICNYNLCKACYKKQNVEKNSKTILTCFKGHKLQ